MTRQLLSARFWAAPALLAGAIFFAAAPANAQPPSAGQQAFGGQWGSSYSSQDWSRFYHYPYIFYPHNFYADGYMQSANDLYHRYPQEMRVPVYNRSWQNFYPKARRYHQGHHFNLDVF